MVEPVFCCVCGTKLFEELGDEVSKCRYCGDVVCGECEREDPLDPHGEVWCLDCYISQNVEEES